MGSLRLLIVIICGLQRRESIHIFQIILKQYVEVLKKLGIRLPYYICLSFVGVKGYRFYAQYSSELKEIDREILNLPEVELLDDNVPIEELIQPSFDILWQACGVSKEPLL